MNENEIRRAFFYAMNEAGLYDATIEWVAPYYRQMHEMMLGLAVESVQVAEKAANKSILALDIGSGTGAEGIALLQALPNLRLLGVDLCGPMNDAFRENAAKVEMSAERYRLLEMDILDSAARHTVQDNAGEAFGASTFQVIISAFTLHHLDTAQKRQIFQLIYELLDPCGVFLLGDLFNYRNESPWLTQTIFKWELEWITSNFVRAAKHAENDSDSRYADKLQALKEQWMQHYHNDNYLEGVTSQMELLKKVGFTEVGTPFRFWQVGLIGAKK